MEFMEREKLSYYHGLGGIADRANDDSSLASQLNGYDPEKMDSVSLYRLKKILEEKNIYSLEVLWRDEDSDPYMYYGSIPQEFWNFDYVYIASDYIPKGIDKKEDYRNWVALSMSLMIDVDKAIDDGVQFEYGKLVASELLTQDQLSTKYIKAICIPIIVKALLKKARQSFSIEQYLIERNNQIAVIKEMLKENGLEIPIIESSTFAYIEDCFDFKDIIESQYESTKDIWCWYKEVHSEQYDLVRQKTLK